MHSSLARPRHCLFGGSFDPVHLGHTGLASAARAHARLDRIIFLPACRSPHKHDQDPPASAHHRLAMLRLAVAPLPYAEVSAWEVDRAGPSYSWQAAEFFAASLGPDIDLCWLLGADQWAVLHTWARPDRLAHLLTFLVVPRNEGVIVPRHGFRHAVVPFHHHASSTAARAAARSCQSLDHLVAPSVADYITRHRIYQT